MSNGGNQQTKDNNKIPWSGFQDQSGQTQTQYADCFHRWVTCLAGTHTSEYRDPQNPGNMHNSHAGPTGEIYNTDCNKGTPITTEAHPNAHRYWGNNACEHIGSHKEFVTWNGVHNNQSQHEQSHTTTNVKTTGSTKTNVRLALTTADIQTSPSGQTGGSSDIDASSDSQRGFDDNGVLRGNHESDSCQTHYGHGYHIYAGGDFGMHVQSGGGGGDSNGGGGGGGGGGNWDCHADARAQLYGQTACYVNSATTVILQAGQSTATITITGDTITIKASNIVLDGQTTTINGTVYLGGSGGTQVGLCGGGCASKVYAQ